MIRRDMSLQDIDPRFLTCFADKSADPFCTLTAQCFIAILRNPDDRHVDRESRMGAMAIVTHAQSLSKICSSCRLKTGVLTLQIGDNNT